MAKLSDSAFIILFAILIFHVSACSAGTSVIVPNKSHAGFYLGGTPGGLDIPTGPDEDGYTPGFQWTIKAGYQFTRFLAIETGYHISGSLNNSSSSTLSRTQSTEIRWFFQELQFPLPLADVKPIIPISSTTNLYFILGIAYYDFEVDTTNLANNMTYSADGWGYNLGLGYESYIINHISLGCKLIYHYFRNNKVDVNAAGQSETVTYPYQINMSFVSLNFVFLYHF